MSRAFRDLLARETPEKRIISIQEVVDQLRGQRGPTSESISQYSRHPGDGGPWLGSASAHQTTRSIYLTKVQIADEEEQLAYCMNDFMEGMTEEQYNEHTFTFTQERWDESPRTPPPVEEANAEVNPVADAVPDANEEADAVGNPDEKTFEEEAANLLNRRKNIILEGPPGTGKTYAMKGIVNALKEDDVFVGKEGKDDFAITMHPATSYEDFIEGLRPGDVAGEFDYSAGVFVEKVKHAIQNPLEQHVVLLDELNRCNVPRVLGDLLTTIESGKRTQRLDFPTDEEINIFDDYDKIECKFVVCSDKTPEGSQFNGFRFSRVAMRWVKTADDEINYYQNLTDLDVTTKTDSFVAGYRRLNAEPFGGTYDIIHPIEPRLNTIKRTVVLIFINGIGHPVLDFNWARYLTFDGQRPDSPIISILGQGGKKYIISSAVDFTLRDGNIIGGGIEIMVKDGEIDCSCATPDPDRTRKRYWCGSCDSKWVKNGRTEITLPGSKKLFHVPNNLLVVGTMNTTDRSVAPLDAALRRRFVFLRVDRSKLSQKELRKLPEGISRTLLKDTQTLWEKLNDQLEGILGKDATIGHSYLYELRTELKNEADPEKLENLVVEFWRYSVLPQVADLLDATGKASDIWGLIAPPPTSRKFEELGLTMNTDKKKYRTFSRTIVEFTEPGQQPEPEPGP